jgi:hypothetical protein
LFAAELGVDRARLARDAAEDQNPDQHARRNDQLQHARRPLVRVDGPEPHHSLRMTIARGGPDHPFSMMRPGAGSQSGCE